MDQTRSDSSSDGATSEAAFSPPPHSVLDVGADRRDAVRWAERAAQLTDRQNPLILDTLAIAYAAAGQFNQAVTTAQTALALARQAGQAGAADRIQNHLKLFQQARPIQQPAPTSQP